MPRNRRKDRASSAKPAPGDLRYELGREIGIDFPRLRLLKIKETRNGKRGLSP